MPSFGTISTNKLSTCDNRIQVVLNESIKILDFSIITGHRTKEEQNALYPRFTKLKWPKGKHNSNPSLACDIAPYIPPYGVIFGGPEQVEKMMSISQKSKSEVNSFIGKAYARLIGVVEAVAFSKNIKIRVGIDWDHDFDMLDQSFHDLGHFEIV